MHLQDVRIHDLEKVLEEQLRNTEEQVSCFAVVGLSGVQQCGQPVSLPSVVLMAGAQGRLSL